MAADAGQARERPRVNTLLLTLICKNLDGNAVVDALVAEDGGGGGKAKITAAQAQAKAASMVKAFTKVGECSAEVRRVPFCAFRRCAPLRVSHHSLSLMSAVPDT